jgi:excisionase family DNA binding protein
MFETSKRLAVSLGEAAVLLGVSVDTLRRAAARSQLKVIRISRRVMIPQTELERIAEHGLGRYAAKPVRAGAAR